MVVLVCAPIAYAIAGSLKQPFESVETTPVVLKEQYQVCGWIYASHLRVTCNDMWDEIFESLVRHVCHHYLREKLRACTARDTTHIMLPSTFRTC